MLRLLKVPQLIVSNPLHVQEGPHVRVVRAQVNRLFKERKRFVASVGEDKGLCQSKVTLRETRIEIDGVLKFCDRHIMLALQGIYPTQSIMAEGVSVV